MSDTIGQFFKQPPNHSDTVDTRKVQPSQARPFSDPHPPPPHPGGQPVAPLSEPSILPGPPAVSIQTPPTIPFTPAPTLSVSAVLPPPPDVIIQTPSIITLSPTPTLSTPALVDQGPASTPGPAKHEDTVNPDSLQKLPVLDDPAELQKHDKAMGRAIPGDQQCRDMVTNKLNYVDMMSDPRHKSVITPGYKGLLSRLGPQIEMMLKNISLSTDVMVNVPGIPGMPGVSLPVGAGISMHGDKIVFKILPTSDQVEQAARQYAQNAITYGKTQAEAAASYALKAGINAIKGNTKVQGKALIEGNGKSFISGKPQLIDSETGAPFPPGTKTALGTKYTGLVDYPPSGDDQYAIDSRDKLQAKQEAAADTLGKNMRGAADIVGGSYNKDVKRETVVFKNKSAIQNGTVAAPTQPKTSLGVQPTRNPTNYNSSKLTHKDDLDASGETTPGSTQLLFGELPATTPITGTHSTLGTSEYRNDVSNNDRDANQGENGEGRLSKLVSGGTDKNLFVSAFSYGERSTRQSTNVKSPTAQLPGDGADGVMVGTPEDDAVYVPLVITDLRPISTGYRSVYFRPFIKSLNESFAPQWALDSYFGRVDKVATYQSTDRTIALSFVIVCFERTDMDIMYKKLSWLASMVYPSYAGSNLLQGPVVRLRVGDLISATGNNGGKGVPGIITSLDFNYDDSTWELDKGMKAPMKVEVSLGFHVLHEGSVGSTNGTFGTMNGGAADINMFRSIG